jgi:hypothetical protein
MHTASLTWLLLQTLVGRAKALCLVHMIPDRTIHLTICLHQEVKAVRVCSRADKTANASANSTDPRPMTTESKQPTHHRLTTILQSEVLTGASCVSTPRDSECLICVQRKPRDRADVLRSRLHDVYREEYLGMGVRLAFYAKNLSDARPGCLGTTCCCSLTVQDR